MLLEPLLTRLDARPTPSMGGIGTREFKPVRNAVLKIAGEWRCPIFAAVAASLGSGSPPRLREGSPGMTKGARLVETAAQTAPAPPDAAAR